MALQEDMHRTIIDLLQRNKHLQSRLAAKEAEVEELREATVIRLKEVGGWGHPLNCRKIKNGSRCDCGWDNFKTALKRGTKIEEMEG